MFTEKEELKLWEAGIFLYLGNTLCLRGGQEQHNLKPSQFHCEYNQDRSVYIKNWLKNNPSGFGSGYQSNKVVTLHINNGFEPQWVVFLLDFYFSKCLQSAETDVFYLRPLSKMHSGHDSLWFLSVPLGKTSSVSLLKKCARQMLVVKHQQQP